MVCTSHSAAAATLAANGRLPGQGASQPWKSLIHVHHTSHMLMSGALVCFKSSTCKGVALWLQPTDDDQQTAASAPGRVRSLSWRLRGPGALSPVPPPPPPHRKPLRSRRRSSRAGRARQQMAVRTQQSAAEAGQHQWCRVRMPSSARLRLMPPWYGSQIDGRSDVA